MPLDGITIHLLTKELAGRIVGSRVEKIHQPARDELVFSLRTRECAMRLLISAGANCPRLHLTEHAPENPEKPPMLCMLFRKVLTGAVITYVRQNGLDRVVFLDFSGTDELGDKTTYTLAVEIMAKHSNIVLVNAEGLIVDSVKRVDFTTSSVRQILPGCRYELPPSQNKLNLLELSAEEVAGAVLQKHGKHLSSALLETVEGFSPLISRETASFVNGGDSDVAEITGVYAERLLTKLKEIQGIAAFCEGTPTVITKDDGRLFDFTFLTVGQYGFSVEQNTVDSFSALLDMFYYEKDRAERTRSRSQSLLKLLNNMTTRLVRKLEAQRAELKTCANREELRVKAELILANQYSLQKGAPFYDVFNYYTNENVRITANPALSPNANAQKYYKEYRKQKTAEQLLGTLIENGEQELAYLESVIDALNRADGFTELSEIRNELYDAGYLKRAKGDKGKRPKPLPPMEYVSSDGYTILVGRNNVQNDMLTFKTARKDDSWFHASKMPGSHVVVVGNGDVLPEQTCREAAALAAYHSSGRDSSRVPVDYTEVRELKKPVGAKPGKVVYHTYNTMWAAPDRALCESLLPDKKA